MNSSKVKIGDLIMTSTSKIIFALGMVETISEEKDHNGECYFLYGVKWSDIPNVIFYDEIDIMKYRDNYLSVKEVVLNHKP